MSRGFSIRRHLALHALLIGLVMLCLALVFVWSQRQTERAVALIIEQEMAPAANLREMESRLLGIYSRMQGVLLTHASPAGALDMLVQERQLIRMRWEKFRSSHRNWTLDHEEAATIEDIEAALPDLWAFLDRVEAAYRVYDPVELHRLVDSGWYPLQQSLLYNLRNLAARQEVHIAAARGKLIDTLQRSLVVVGSLLAAGLLLLLLFAAGLSRYVMRRIDDIEKALESVASGQTAVSIPCRDGETEMTRIATAINRTVARLGESHDAVAALMRHQQTILESAAEGIYGVDADGRIMFINPAALAILGYREHEVLGRNAHDLFHHHHPDGRPYDENDCPLLHSRRDGIVVQRDDEVFFDRHGTTIAVEYTCAPLPDLDASRGGVVIFRDVAERRRQEQLLRQTVAQLRETNARLATTQGQLIQAEKLAAIGQLAAGVAHEINNPIGFINSNFGTLATYTDELLALIDADAELIRSGADAATQGEAERRRTQADLGYLRQDLRELLAETRDGLRRVTRIVADLKDFSRVNAGAEWEDIDLRQALDTTLSVLATPLAAKAEVIRDYAALPAVRCNAAQINLVIMNLLLNAADAIDSRGTITVRAWRVDGQVCIEVRDSGHGMEAAVRERMFEPFFTTRPVGAGTGLGLSVAYSIIQNHGGRFEVDSAPAQGTSIRFWLPIAGKPPAA